MVTKISKVFAQQIVNSVKDVCGYHINFIDASGIIFASTDERRIGNFHEVGFHAAKTGETIEVSGDEQFLGTQKGVNIPVFHNGNLLAVIGISGNPNDVRSYAHLAMRITKLLIREQELEASNRTHLDKIHYIIHSLTHEVTNRLYLSQCLIDMNIDEACMYRSMVFLLDNRYNTKNVSFLEQKLYELFDSIPITLYAYNFPNEFVALIPDELYNQNLVRFRQFAKNYREILSVGVGNSSDLFHLKMSYENSYVALKSVENSEIPFSCYDTLDLALILGKVDSITREAFREKTIASLSTEEQELLKTYYVNNMSLQLTSEKLYLHKNTLQYKLDRIHKNTGYNPRIFQDAIILFLALRL